MNGTPVVGLSTGDWLTLCGIVIGAVIWFVRLEGRVNTNQNRHDDFVSRVQDQRSDDTKHIDDKFRSIAKTLESIERKLDELAPFGLGLRGLGRRATDPENT